MEMTIKSTSKIIEVNGVPARVWEGVSSRGTPVHAYITRVAVQKDDHDHSEFQRELQECVEPSSVVASLPGAIKL